MCFDGIRSKPTSNSPELFLTVLYFRANHQTVYRGTHPEVIVADASSILAISTLGHSLYILGKWLAKCPERMGAKDHLGFGGKRLRREPFDRG